MNEDDIQDIGFIQQSSSGQMPCPDRATPQYDKSSGIRYFSMFTGVGGFELGLQRKGQCIGFSEIDKYANQLLANKFPDIKNYGDATKINPSELPDFDMLCGGFPCQSFSIAGKRRGFNDTRGTMFFHIARILKIKRPKLIFLENVKGLLNHDQGKTFSIIIQTLEELGYRVTWMVLNSKFFGVPQNRERVFIIASLRNEPRPEILPFRTNNTEVNELNQGTRQEINIIDDVVRINKGKRGDRVKIDGDCFTLNSIEQRGIAYALDANYHKGTRDLKKCQRTMIGMNVVGKHISQQGRVYGDDGISPTIAGGSKLSGDCTPRIMSGVKIRRLTPIECERLQGFPDNWTASFSDTQRYKMMGNAVTVNVIKAIGERWITP